MLKDFFGKLSRRRFGQALLAGGAALVGIRWLTQKLPLAMGRGTAGRALTGVQRVSMREAEFYEVERRLL